MRSQKLHGSKLRNLAFGFFTFASVACGAQYNETIRTARPGQSIQPFTTGAGIFQLQSGVDVYGSKSSGCKSLGLLHNSVFRFGISERVEASALINYGTVHSETGGETTTLKGLDGFDVGGRVSFLQGEGLVPGLGLDLRARLPVLSTDYEIKKIAPRFILATSQQLTDKLTLFTNWGGYWNGINSDFTGTYTVNLAFPLSGKLGTYIENYGSLSNGVFETRWDTGLGYLVTNNFQIDTYGGIGANRGVNDWFLSVGISWRTKKK